MDQASEDALLARCRAGSEAAFGELVDHHKNFVFAVILRSTRDPAHAEDLAQEVFIRMYRGLPHFRGDSRLTTWIYRIVRNICVEDSKRRHSTQSLNDMPENREPGTIDPQFRDIELHDRLSKAMEQLSEQSRLIVAAHYFGGRQYEQIAEDMDMPLGTVKTHLHRAKRRLRELLSEPTGPRHT
jgi:RNA polymerase sigma-70 factor (ECF subfamily)